MYYWTCCIKMAFLSHWLVFLIWLPFRISSRSFHKIEEIALLNKLLSHHRNVTSSSSLSDSFALISKRGSYYGEPCESTDDCASYFGLTCTNATCVCSSPDFIARLNPDKPLTSGKRTECVLRAGSKCGMLSPFKQRSNNDMGFTSDVAAAAATRTLPAAYFWNKLRKNIPFFTEIAGGGGPLDFFDSDSNCVDNAHCTGGVCRCSPEHFKDSRGLCLRKRSVFQPCDDNGQCRMAEGLQCSEGKCQCSMSMVFDRVKRKCFIPVGGECDAYSSSVEMECIRNADCSNERCICLDGYKMSSDGTCGVAHGGLCDMQANTCSDIQLTCRSGRCQCRYPVHQVYNETSGQCLSKPDGPCIPSSLISLADESSSFSQNCIPLTECVKSDSADEANVIFDYVCKCMAGYAEDSSGNCVPSYSSECIEDEDCDQVIGQLTCINGRCACPDEMLVWDETRRKCVGVVGARCKFIQLERILSFRMDVPTECIENGICVEHVSRLDGRCECKIGYEFSKSQQKCTPM